ncbi:TetR/AcrR family transcriptional regulator, partial [Sedimentitalea sp. XS_ASV28]
VESVEAPAGSISVADCNFFRCFLDPELFDHGLEFADSEWSRRDGAVRQRIDAADGERLRAVRAMYERFGYSEYDADTRARILYFMQLGYHALELREPMSER